MRIENWPPSQMMLFIIIGNKTRISKEYMHIRLQQAHLYFFANKKLKHLLWDNRVRLRKIIPLIFCLDLSWAVTTRSTSVRSSMNARRARVARVLHESRDEISTQR